MYMMLGTSYFKNVYVASDGAEGLQIYQEKKPNVIFTDILMPGVNGIEFAYEIRKTDETTPIIFLTAHEEPEYIEMIEKISNSRHFLKPIQIKVIIENL